MVSIYEAELKKKRGVPRKLVEDQLTSRFFGALAMMPGDIVLPPFLRALAKGIGQTTEDLDVLSKLSAFSKEHLTKKPIALWEHVGEKYPDVCIDTNTAIVIIEVKKEKIRDLERFKQEVIGQYEGAKHEAKKNNKDLIYFVVTNDILEPPEISEVRLALRRKHPAATIHWRSWFQASKWLQAIASTAGLDHTAKKLIDATRRLLEDMEKMRKPSIEEEWFSQQISDSLEKAEKLATEIRITFNLVRAKIAEHGLMELRQGPKSQRFDFNERELAEDSCWIPKCFDLYYVSRNWEQVDKADAFPKLYITFNLERAREEGNGITVGVCGEWQTPAGELVEESNIEELVNEIRDKLNTKEYQGLRLHNEQLDNGYLQIYENVELDGLAQRDIAEELVERLVKMREFTESLSKFRKTLGLEGVSKPTKRAK